MKKTKAIILKLLFQLTLNLETALQKNKSEKMLDIKSIERVVLGFILIVSMYPLLVFTSIEKWTLINFFIYSCTLLISIFCLESIRRNCATSWNLFGFCYFFCFWLNTLQFSELQVEKTLFDLYAMLCGPLIFIFLLMFSEKIRVNPVRIKSSFLSLNCWYVLFITFYLLFTFYIHKKVGWRIDVIRNEHRIVSGNEFVVPFFSGLWSTIAWMLVILAPHVKKRYAVIAIILICIVSGILHVKRGDLIRIILFFIIYFLTTKSAGIKSETRKKYMVAFLIVMGIIIFVTFGQWRLAQSGNNDQTIINLAEVRANSAFLAWLFAYSIVQFDVFSVSSAALQSIPYQLTDFDKLFMPISSVSSVLDNPLIPIKGFNAGTAFWSFVRDYGCLFFVEMVVFGLMISLLLFLSKKTDCKGAYSFICMLCALMVFGNFFSNRSMILAIIFSNIIYFISKNSNTKAQND